MSTPLPALLVQMPEAFCRETCCGPFRCSIDHYLFVIGLQGPILRLPVSTSQGSAFYFSCAYERGNL